MTLEQWLQRATRGLSKDSAEQVRREIAEHCESAAAEGVDAVQALGDPGIANCEYRKVLLTPFEARMLRDTKWEGKAMCSRPWLKWALLAIPVFTVVGTLALFLSGETRFARMVLAPGVVVSLLVLAPFLPVYTPSRGRIFRVVKWALLVAAILLAFGPTAKDSLVLILTCAWPFVWMEMARVSLRRKLPVKQWPKALYL